MLGLILAGLCMQRKVSLACESQGWAAWGAEQTQAGTEGETLGEGEIVINDAPDINPAHPPGLLLWFW